MNEIEAESFADKLVRLDLIEKVLAITTKTPSDVKLSDSEFFYLVDAFEAAWPDFVITTALTSLNGDKVEMVSSRKIKIEFSGDGKLTDVPFNELVAIILEMKSYSKAIYSLHLSKAMKIDPDAEMQNPFDGPVPLEPHQTVIGLTIRAVANDDITVH